VNDSIVFARLVQCVPASNTLPWAHPSHNLERNLYRFSCFSQLTADSLYFTMGRPFSPQNVTSHGDLWTPSNTWFPGPTRMHNRLDRFSRFCRAHECDRPTDRQTDHTTPCATIRHINV